MNGNYSPSNTPALNKGNEALQEMDNCVIERCPEKLENLPLEIDIPPRESACRVATLPSRFRLIRSFTLMDH